MRSIASRIYSRKGIAYQSFPDGGHAAPCNVSGHIDDFFRRMQPRMQQQRHAEAEVPRSKKSTRRTQKSAASTWSSRGYVPKQEQAAAASKEHAQGCSGRHMRSSRHQCTQIRVRARLRSWRMIAMERL